MKHNNKFGALALTATFLTACTLYADTDAQVRNLDHRMQALEAKRNSCALINPPARPTQKCDFGGYLTVDPLLLKPQENGIEFVAKTQLSGLPVLSGNTRAKTVNFNWDWGFRLGLGANLEHDGWDIFLNWMQFRTHANRFITPNATETLFPVLPHPGSVGNEFGNATASAASSKWKLHLNEIDLEGGRQFFVSKWLTVKPHAGFRTAWIRQKDHVKYLGLVGPAFPLGKVDMKCNYWGLGIRGGLDTQWGIACGWSVVANYAASILYGFFNSHHNEAAIFASGARSNLFSFKDFYHVGRVITDFLIGLRYDYMFCEERYHVGVQAGWEHHMFFGQNQFIRFADDVAQASMFANQGDLSLQGFSLDVRFDF
ncbi:MAG TPA: Lpg1974 family pore-forming outer membrane protein [Rhabdochlamydiaceae bacterium]|nr:Lpg1974 family pore-forming outer membrane protein [Rhabdochlamydiaceae bacterium]